MSAETALHTGVLTVSSVQYTADVPILYVVHGYPPQTLGAAIPST